MLGRSGSRLDDCWDCYDPPCGPDCPYCGRPDEDLFGYRLREFLRSLTDLPAPLVPFEWAVDAGSNEAAEAAASSPPSRQASVGIERRLASHVDRLMAISSSAAALRPEMAEAIGDWRNLEAIRRVAERGHAPGLTTRVCMFAPFWLRNPRTWNPESGRPLLRHVFALYEVPAFLYSEWFRESDITRFKWLCWFILLAQGGSLRRASEIFGWNIPAGFSHHFTASPPDASPVEACVIAEVRRLRGDETDCRRVLRNLAFVVDPTERSADASHAGFWHDTVRWLIAHREAINDDESDRILSWAMHQYTEAARSYQSPFWKRRGVRAVLESSNEYHRRFEAPVFDLAQLEALWYGLEDVGRPSHDYQWQSHGWDWTLEDPPHHVWSFVELTSGDALNSEGQVMRHCVGSYAGRCATGYSAIVSLRHNSGRRISIEITPRTRQIVQARGPHNREANVEEQRVISQWMATVVRPDA